MSVTTGERTGTRNIAGTLLVVYAALLAWALLSPSNHAQSGLIRWMMEPLSHVGVPYTHATFNRLEVLMNAAIIAPFTFLASLVIIRVSWQQWTAYAFLGSAMVEAFQGLFLPHRQASFSDIVANTFGALVGALIVRMFRPKAPGAQRV